MPAAHAVQLSWSALWLETLTTIVIVDSGGPCCARCDCPNTCCAHAVSMLCPCCACCAVELERAVAGDIVSIAGVAAAGIADTVAALEVQKALPPGGWVHSSLVDGVHLHWCEEHRAAGIAGTVAAVEVQKALSPGGCTVC